MSRIGWKGGRFNVNYETSEIYRGLRDWQRWTGDKVNYFKFIYDQSNVDPVYGEAVYPLGRIYFGPTLVPALHVIHIEGANEDRDEGFYYNDTAHVTMSFDQVNRLGLEQDDLTTQTQAYLKDRFEYRGKIYRVTNIQILGQIQRKPIIITIDGTQVRSDELVNDPQFAQYAQDQILPLDYIPNAAIPGPMSKEIQQVIPTLNGPDPASVTGYGYGFYNADSYGG